MLVLVVKNPPANAGDKRLGLGRSPGEGNGNPLQYPCLENLMDRRAWWAAVHGIAKSRAWLGDYHLHLLIHKKVSQLSEIPRGYKNHLLGDPAK